MATKPTRFQEQACDRIAQALLLVTEAARLDPRGQFGLRELEEVAERLSKAASAFDLDSIVGRALESRGRALGLRSGTADLLMLMEGEAKPLEALLLSDEAFRERVAAMEAELGEF